MRQHHFCGRDGSFCMQRWLLQPGFFSDHGRCARLLTPGRTAPYHEPGASADRDDQKQQNEQQLSHGRLVLSGNHTFTVLLVGFGFRANRNKTEKSFVGAVWSGISYTFPAMITPRFCTAPGWRDLMLNQLPPGEM